MAPRQVFHCSVTCLRHLVLLLIAVHSAGPTGWCCQLGGGVFAGPLSLASVAEAQTVCEAPRRTCCGQHPATESGTDPTGSSHGVRCCCPRDAAPPETRVVPTQPADDLSPLFFAGREFLTSLVPGPSLRAVHEVLSFGGRPVRVHAWNCCWLC
ncbi:MAG: hypothetical protein ACKOJF_16570 [Planctomycetaceae bacterium]